VVVRDNGAGTAPTDLHRPRSHGIAGIRHRINVLGGRLDISSVPGRGTTIRATVPLASVSRTSADDCDSGTYRALALAPGSVP
jgi:signal transduction histidine kinase